MIRTAGDSLHFHSFLLQPAKLAEAFKYFVQGMGYSEYGLSQQGVGRGAAVGTGNGLG